MPEYQFEKILPRLVAAAKADPQLDALYLYGSHAKGTATDKSDIDLAVIFSEDEQNALERRLRPELLALDWNQALGLPENTLSILDLEIAPVPLAMAVLKTGKLLVNKNPGHDFEVCGKIMSRWEIDHLYHHEHFG